MPSFDRRTNFHDKKLMSREDYYNYFFLFLSDKLDEVVSSTFVDNAGVLSDDTIDIIAGTGASFSLDTTDASKGTDGSGNIMDLFLVTSSWYTNVPFENTLSTVYYVGIKYASVVDEIYKNPRTGKAEYKYYKESIGELGNPDSVTDNTTNITLVIDGLLENGVDHSGMPVAVWLENPVATTTANGIWTGTTTYDSGSGENRVVISYSSSAGPLGQTNPPYSISTTAADYKVHIQGVSWSTVDFSTDSDYVFIGTVTGAGGSTPPSVFDTSNQVSALYMSLQNAYYAGTSTNPAPGRKIVADRGAVEISQSNTSARNEDVRNTTLILDQKDSTFSSTNLLCLEPADMSAATTDLNYPEFFLKSIVTTNVQASETGTTSSGSNTITLTRPSVDAQEIDAYKTSSEVSPVIVSGTTDQIDDGLYWCLATSATNITCINLDGSTPSFNNESCTVRFFLSTRETTTTDWTATTSSSPTATHKFGFARVNNGVEITHRGSLSSEKNEAWLQCSEYDSGKSIFYQIFGGRHYLRGGGTNFNNSYVNDNVVGHANITVDKRTTDNLTTDWRPDETLNEMGFDFRGTNYSKTTTDEPGFQMGYSCRIPYKYYDGGNDYIQVEEPFTHSAGPLVNLTRVGVDASYLPVEVTGCNVIFAELQYSSADLKDEIYIVKSSTSTSVTLQNFDGSPPTLSSGSGNIRFYGGAYFGCYDTGTVAGVTPWVGTIVPPTPDTGGLKFSHNTDDTVTSADDRFLLLTQNNATVGFAVRDGGQTYARALTTKDPTSTAPGFLEWDSVVTTNLRADNIYTGSGPTGIVKVQSSSEAYMDFVKPSAGVWNVTKELNIFNAVSQYSGTDLDWKPNNRGSNGLVSTGASGTCRIPIEVPYGSTITSVTINVTTADASGSFGFEVQRSRGTKGSGSPTITDLNSTTTFKTATSSASNQDVTYTCDQNNGVVSSTDQFYIVVESAVSSDLILRAHVDYNIPQSGRNLLYTC